MFPATPSGFVGAPVSLLLLASLISVSLLASTLQLRALLSLNLSNFRFTDFISFFGWPLYLLTCVSTKELICAGMLLYQARYLERLGGSKKYISSIGVFGVLTTLILLSILVIFPNLGSNSDPDLYEIDGAEGFVGPTALIFAQLAVMTVEVPAIHQFSIFGLPLSEKLFSYLLALQLLMSRSSASLIQAIVGILVGYAYVKNFFGIADFRFPTILSMPLIKLGSLLADVKKTTTNSRNPLQNAARAVPTVTAAAQPQPQARAPPANPAAAPRRPEDPRVQQLLQMGFDRRDVITALELSNLDVDMALNLLLDDQRRRQ